MGSEQWETSKMHSTSSHSHRHNFLSGTCRSIRNPATSVPSSDRTRRWFYYISCLSPYKCIRVDCKAKRIQTLGKVITIVIASTSEGLDVEVIHVDNDVVSDDILKFVFVALHIMRQLS